MWRWGVLKQQRCRAAGGDSQQDGDFCAMASQLATRVVDMGRRPCGLCLSTTKWIPVVFIAAVVCWSYYAYVVELCFYTISSYVEKIIYLLVYHVVLVMFVWAYYQTVMTPVRRVPPQFTLGSADFETFESTDDNQVQIQILENHVVKSSLPVYNRTVAGTFRFCDKCRHIKPDRCHHCSVCGECVLKMDHHCPWVNNCIGFSNYKFFILFLGYAFLYCMYVALTTLQYFIVFWRNGLEGTAKFHILFVFFVASMFGISLISLFGYHCYLVLRNQSTLETFRSPIFQSGPDKHGFHMGRLNNFCEVFGDSKQRWFLPVFTSFGDGVAFPMRYVPAVSGVGPVGYGATGSPTQLPNISLGDGVSYPQRHVDDDTDGLMGRQRWMEDDNDDDDDTQIDTLRTLSTNGAHDSTASDSRPDVRINMG